MNVTRGTMNEISFSATADRHGDRSARIARRPTFSLAATAPRSAYSLLELLIVIVLMGIMARLLISSSSPTLYSQLSSTAGVIAGEMAYARSLAVGNNSSYRFDVDTAGNRLILSHTGADSMLNTLPRSPYRSPTDPTNQYIVALANLPRLGVPVSLLGAQAVGSTTQNITSVEFGSYGQTTQANQTVIWLTAGAGNRQGYISVQVNPVTGMATVGTYQTTRPAGL